MSSIKIAYPGLYTTIQDLGREGHADAGVPESGAMDKQALRLSNLLLNNPESSAVIESTLMGPNLLFLKPTIFVLTGAITKAFLGGKKLEMNRVYTAKKGALLKVGNVLQGCRTYIGLDGGIASDTVMNSRSMFYPLTSQSRLHKGDVLKTNTSNFGELKGGRVHVSPTNLVNRKAAVQTYKGPEFGHLSSQNQRHITQQLFTIGSGNRMGIALQEILTPETLTILTGPVLPGTVQLTPSGRLYVLMRDCQTTGGYPRVLQLPEHSINRLAQMVTGEKIRLSLH